MTLSLIVLGFTLGLRHGIDYDHIAAITDLAGGAGAGGREGSNPLPGFALATFYALGHALVVVALGLLALWVGAVLPDWVDTVMERVVGITMLALAGWLLHNLWQHWYSGEDIQLKSRWRLMLDGANHALNHLFQREHQHTEDISGRNMNRTAFGIGMLHGIGAETGSQALLLASIAGVSTPQVASVVLGVFVLGLLISNTLIAVLAAIGCGSAGNNRGLTVTTAVVTTVFSLIVGVVFITGQGTALPHLL